MSILLKNVLVLDLNSPVHGKQSNILIEKGIITSLNGKSASKEYDLKGKTVTSGWVDLNAQFHDPGFEYREDIVSGTKVAQAGGFTDVCLSPETYPPIETKSDVSYILKKTLPQLNLHVGAAVSEGLKGENLTEMMDLHEAGANVFSDGDFPIWNAELLLKALQYTNSMKVSIFQNARDAHISANTQMHEGRVSTNLGLRGEPSLSEELIIQRDIEILKYSGGNLHFSRISSAKSVDLIRSAKKAGLSVTCDVGIHHLLFTDESIGEFDSIFKVIPPYRSEKDRKALVKGVKEGVIDALCSNHRPFDQECKQLEFDLADPGNISLQTFYASLLRISEDIPLETLIERVTNGPRSILRLENIKIDVDQSAKLTVLDPHAIWKFDTDTNLSKSQNSPYWNAELTGSVVGTINGSKATFNQ
ncbi:dihydroorotase [Ekhidna sp.]|uniref:dihydroorotase n=1 Tax=Ekhidna sp. TaxID=2608089 RepID=UPI003297C7DA